MKTVIEERNKLGDRDARVRKNIRKGPKSSKQKNADIRLKAEGPHSSHE